MSIKTKALIFNLVCFALLFFVFRFLFGMIFTIPSLGLAFISAVWASILTPKFFVKDDILWIKIPFVLNPKKL